MKLFVSSLLLLFVELVLIRWIGTEVNVFAYLQNVLLICCYMGFGIGLCSHRRERSVAEFITPLLIVVVLMIIPVGRQTLGQLSIAVSALGQGFVAWNIFHSTDLTLNYLPSIILGLLLIFLIMLLVTLIFVPLGAWIGEGFDRESILKSYAWNLAGSLLGIWLFNLVSALAFAPNFWFLLISTLTLLRIFIHKDSIPNFSILGIILLPLIIGAADLNQDSKQVAWSPYQKLLLREVHSPPYEMEGQYVLVNNSGYQIMLDLRTEQLQRRKDLYTRGWDGYTQYDLPFRFMPSAKSALLLGGGSGNDAAGAIRARIDRVVAVDIDPVIIDFGKSYHPERPYSHPSVEVSVNDARAYLASSQQKFDVISFGLLDSHTTGQMTNARLDHYVYTLEALEQVAQRLSSNGIITLTFEVSKPYIADRMRTAVRKTLGNDPLILKIPKSPYGFGGIMFISGNPGTISAALAQDPKLRELVQSFKHDVPRSGTIATTDDWPYLYLERPSIPLLFLFIPVLALGVFALVSRRAASGILRGRITSSDIYFALLGASFLLLEVAGISQAAIVLGTAWQPIAAVITGVLLMAMAANWFVLRFKPNMLISAILVVACALLLFFFNFRDLLNLSYSLRFLLTAILVCSPVFFSGMLFSAAFAKSFDAQRALAMNALGAVAGVFLQNFSFLYGIRFQFLIVASLYLLAGLLWKLRLESVTTAHPGE